MLQRVGVVNFVILDIFLFQLHVYVVCSSFSFFYTSPQSQLTWDKQKKIADLKKTNHM